MAILYMHIFNECHEKTKIHFQWTLVKRSVVDSSSSVRVSSLDRHVQVLKGLISHSTIIVVMHIKHRKRLEALKYNLG